MTMSAQTKTAIALLALAGGLFATAVLAEKGEGPGGRGPHGAMLLETFDEIDADKDGKLTPAELAAHRAARFAAADANKDGLLNAEELTAFQVAEITKRMADRTARMITWSDANGDGSLSADEMPAGPDPVRLARLDTDGDGAISKAEAAMKRMGDRMRKHHKDMPDDN
jgi:hypothetical protein